MECPFRPPGRRSDAAGQGAQPAPAARPPGASGRRLSQGPRRPCPWSGCLPVSPETACSRDPHPEFPRGRRTHPQMALTAEIRTEGGCVSCRPLTVACRNCWISSGDIATVNRLAAQRARPRRKGDTGGREGGQGQATASQLPAPAHPAAWPSPRARPGPTNQGRERPLSTVRRADPGSSQPRGPAPARGSRYWGRCWDTSGGSPPNRGHLRQWVGHSRAPEASPPPRRPPAGGGRTALRHGGRRSSGPAEQGLLPPPGQERAWPRKQLTVLPDTGQESAREKQWERAGSAGSAARGGADLVAAAGPESAFPGCSRRACVWAETAVWSRVEP